ncbi:unnamed protein product [Kuraishia capsulata CBS 1993]|uniref:Uncharacterized protein n=1 Tax=Kuraishia capsulata CBS 1993 TaxID=1382522 RepID=W6MT69_9ASCO|nr:uncharacterized protein KUCA_T00000922001 [Kuraishia capsulata CBS 1993]CDK24955.1 unnamed protein product [Kuraishia capsulata CBS 1993]
MFCEACGTITNIYPFFRQVVQGGMVIDTNTKKIVAAVDDANKQKDSSSYSSSRSLPSALSALGGVTNSAGAASIGSRFFGSWGS